PLVRLRRGGVPAAQPPGRPGVATHQLLLAVLAAGAQGRGRRGAAAEIWAALRHSGPYRGSVEELTPVRGDPRAALPVVMAAAMMLARPALWRVLASGSVAGYALTPAGWDSLLTTPPALRALTDAQRPCRADSRGGTTRPPLLPPLPRRPACQNCLPPARQPGGGQAGAEATF